MKSPAEISGSGINSPAGLLAVMSAEPERRQLKACLAGSLWTLYEAGNIHDAEATMAREDVAAIITDRSLPDGTWIDLLEATRSRSNPPRVVVFSPVADDRFWAEVLYNGGYDLLATPFDREEVLRSIQMAWVSWRRTARVSPEGDLSDPFAAPKQAAWFARAGR